MKKCNDALLGLVGMIWGTLCSVENLGELFMGFGFSFWLENCLFIIH